MGKRRIQHKVIPGTIQIGIVAYRNVPVKFLRSLSDILLWPTNDILGMTVMGSARHEYARNSVIKDFLTTHAEWLLWIDTDATFRYDAPHRLRKAAKEADAEMAHALSFGYRNSDQAIFIGAWNDKGQTEVTDYEPGSRFWVEGVGCHFFLVHRTVYEKVEYPWHESHMGASSISEKPIGHDLAFCLRAGGRVLYCSDIPTGHLKDWEVNEESWQSWKESRDS